MRIILGVAVVLSLLLWSCVDIPETGPQLPDPQTVTRYIHLMTGTDTVSYFLSRDVSQQALGTRQTYSSVDTQVTRVVTISIVDTTITRDTIATSIEQITCHSSTHTCDTTFVDFDSIAVHLNIRRDTLVRFDTTVNTYSITLADTNKIKTTKSYYMRYAVKYDSTLQMFIDGAAYATLQFGESTPYREIPSGDRKIQLVTSGIRLDTLEYIVIDTTHAVKRDTLGRGKFTFEETVTKKTTNKYPIIPHDIDLVVADSTTPSKEHSSFHKATIFFLRNAAPLFTDANGEVRYGVVNYAFGSERRLFTPAPSDSIGIRFVNVSKGPVAKSLTIKGIPANDSLLVIKSVDSLATNDFSTYVKLRQGTYSFFASPKGSPSSIGDSVSQLTLYGGNRLTFAIVDSGSTYRLKKYNDD